MSMVLAVELWLLAAACGASGWAVAADPRGRRGVASVVLLLASATLSVATILVAAGVL